MYPVLRDNDLVVVREAVPESLRRGNILVYRKNEAEYVVHRFVKKGKGDRLYLKGDGYNLPLELTTPDCIIGKAVGFVRNRHYEILNRKRELHSWSVSMFKEHLKRLVRHAFCRGK
jgi:hypothetical protein